VKGTTNIETTIKVDKIIQLGHKNCLLHLPQSKQNISFIFAATLFD
jgi:hypothetical protein